MAERLCLLFAERLHEPLKEFLEKNTLHSKLVKAFTRRGVPLTEA
ncbi:MAG: hypothetical protein QXR81_05025 [Candidatus Nezhaarchaeales archaeon]